MFHPTILVGSFIVAVSAATSSTFCKGGLPALAAVVLSGNPLVTSYCSSVFPLPTTTSTFTAQATTISPTVATSTVTTVVSTATVTQTSSPAARKRAVTTMTTTPTKTSTTTTTSAKAAVGINAAQASALSSLVAQGSAFVGSACSCLETQRTATVTTTPTATAGVTATTTTSVTTTTTVTVAPATSTACNSAQRAYCADAPIECDCHILVDGHTAVCSGSMAYNEHFDLCKTDADCVDFIDPMYGPARCAFDDPTKLRAAGHNICLANGGHCPADRPAQRMKREIEGVFEAGGAGGVSRRGRITG